MAQMDADISEGAGILTDSPANKKPRMNANGWSDCRGPTPY